MYYSKLMFRRWFIRFLSFLLFVLTFFKFILWCGSTFFFRFLLRCRFTFLFLSFVAHSLVVSCFSTYAASNGWIFTVDKLASCSELFNSWSSLCRLYFWWLSSSIMGEVFSDDRPNVVLVKFFHPSISMVVVDMLITHFVEWHFPFNLEVSTCMPAWIFELSPFPTCTVLLI